MTYRQIVSAWVVSVYRLNQYAGQRQLKRYSSTTLFPEGQVRTLKVRDGVLSPQILAFAAKDNDVFSYEALAADH